MSFCYKQKICKFTMRVFYKILHENSKHKLIQYHRILSHVLSTNDRCCTCPPTQTAYMLCGRQTQPTEATAGYTKPTGCTRLNGKKNICRNSMQTQPSHLISSVVPIKPHVQFIYCMYKIPYLVLFVHA